jgi:hypothetical protein
LITTNVEVQELVLSCLKKYQLPWLNPYLTEVKHLVGYHLKPSVFKQFSLSNVEKEHKDEFIPFLIRVLVPSVKPKKPTKRLSLKEKLAEHKKWKMGIKNLLAYFSILDKNELSMFIQTIIPPDMKVDSSNSRVNNKLKWMLSIIEQVIMMVSDEYSFYYETILDILLKISLRDLDESKIEGDLEDEKEIEKQAEEQEEKEEMEQEEQEEVEKEEQEVDKEETEDKMEIEGENKTEKKPKSKKKSEKILHAEVKHHAIQLIALFFKRHGEFSFSKKYIDTIFNTTKFYFGYLKENPSTFPKFFDIPFSMDGTISAAYFVAHFDFIENLLSLPTNPLISVKVFRSIINFFESLHAIKSDSFQLNENLEKLLGKTKFKEIQSKKIGDILLRPSTNLMIKNFYEAINLPSQIHTENRKTALNLIDLSKDYFNDETDSNIIITLYAENIDNIKDPVLIQEAIALFKRYLPNATEETKVKYIKLFSNIFLKQHDVEIRRGMCEIFARIFANEPKTVHSFILTK